MPYLRNVLKAWELPADGNSAHKAILLQLVCGAATEKCYERLCSSCLNKSLILNQMLESFDEEAVEEISYKQWIATDRLLFKFFPTFIFTKFVFFNYVEL